MTIERTAERLEARGHVTRLEIYRRVVRAGEDGLAVGEPQKRVGIPLTTLSHHLRKLVLVDLVTRERRGTTLICRANCAVMRAVLSFMTEECCADANGCKAASAALRFRLGPEPALIVAAQDLDNGTRASYFDDIGIMKVCRRSVTAP